MFYFGESSPVFRKEIKVYLMHFVNEFGVLSHGFRIQFAGDGRVNSYRCFKVTG